MIEDIYIKNRRLDVVKYWLLASDDAVDRCFEFYEGMYFSAFYGSDAELSGECCGIKPFLQPNG